MNGQWHKALITKKGKQLLVSEKESTCTELPTVQYYSPGFTRARQKRKEKIICVISEIAEMSDAPEDTARNNWECKEQERMRGNSENKERYKASLGLWEAERACLKAER